MSVHCNKCGYENDLQHSFCGKCGAKLPVVDVAEQPAAPSQPAPPQKPLVPASASPSILGLADQPADQDRLSYLLEEEEPPSPRWPRLLMLGVALGAVGFAGWHWREGVRNWMTSLISGSKASQITEAPAAAPTPPPEPTAQVPNSAPATSPEGSPPVPDPKTSTQPQAAPAQSASTPAPEAPATRIATSDGDPPKPASNATDAQNANPPTTTPQAAEEKKAELPAEAATVSPPATPAPKASRPTPEAAASAVDAMEAEGERYLYGNGVLANCAIAQKRLLAAAKLASAKAQSVLGTMYATGHCVNRDLPVAYRWFAKALHQDSSNTRYERDLEVLWRQMTEEERQLALKSQ